VFLVCRLLYILTYTSHNLQQNFARKVFDHLSLGHKVKKIFPASKICNFQHTMSTMLQRWRIWRQCLQRWRRGLCWPSVSCTSPQKPPATYTRVNDYGPHTDSIFRGRLIRGATNVRVYVVIQLMSWINCQSRNEAFKFENGQLFCDDGGKKRKRKNYKKHLTYNV